MGRKERRAQEKLQKKQNNQIDLYLKAKANQNKLKEKEVDRIQNELMDMNVSAMFCAFGLYLKTKYNANDIDIANALKWIDDTVGDVGTERFPTLSDFKLYCASETGIAIGLNEEEMKQFDISESEKYMYMIITSKHDQYIQKIMIIHDDKNRNTKIIKYIGGINDGYIGEIPSDLVLFNNIDEASKYLKKEE